MNQLLHKKLNLMAHLAMIDGRFDHSERKFLNELLREHGLAENYQLEHGQIALDELKETPDKSELLYWSLKMIQADGVIHADERAYCKLLALKLGFRTDLIDTFADNFSISYSEFARYLKGFTA